MSDKHDDPQHQSFRDWMDQHRLRAEDVAGALQVSEQTIHNWRSSGIPPRRLPHVQSFMDHWVAPHDRDRDRDATTGQIHTPAPVPADLRLDAFIMRPGEEEFDDWNRAANAAGLTVREWITDTLERAAREFKRTGRLPGTPPHSQPDHYDIDDAVVAFPPARTRPAASSNKRPPAASSLNEEAPARAPQRKSTKATPAATHWIDLHGGVAAGAPISSHLTAEPVATRQAWPDDHYALRVFGQSMEPRIPDGTLIIVRRWPSGKGIPKKGTIVIYSDGTGSTLKEFGYRKAKPGELTDADSMGNLPVLRSLNPAYPEVQTLEGGKIDAILVDIG